MTDDSIKPEQPEPTEPKRRWQFSLRSLLIVMVLFAWGGVKIQEAEKQKAAVVFWLGDWRATRAAIARMTTAAETWDH